MAGATYQPKTYHKQDADEYVIASGGKLNMEPGSSHVVATEIATTNRTVLASESGMVFIANAVDLVFTLPATALGLTYTFITATVSAGTGLSVSPVAADTINEGTDDKDLINSGATDVLGDAVTIVGDGAGGWYTVSQIGTWAEE